ncbi:MAG TPA: pilus assembly protein PilB, partial [Gammaproteobacteria bacterium]|nr:pilus assembly protein PilB [Gammaproteobacteria bacterium]
MFVPHSAIKEQGAELPLSLVPLDEEDNEENQTEAIEENIEIKPTTPPISPIKDTLSNAVSSPEELEAAIKRHENSPNIRLGEALIQEGLITESQLQEALNEQKKKRDVPLGEILVTMKALTSDEMKKTLASKLGIPFVNLKRFSIDIAAADMVPEKICRRHNVMPLCLYDSKLIVAVENPLYRLPLEDLRFHTKTFVEAVMASPEDIEWAIGKHYGTQIDEIAMALDSDDIEDEINENIAESDNALVNLVNKMIMDAYAQGASDIHIEPNPGKKKTLVRFRKDGELVPYVELAPSYRNALISRLKVMCDLDISERRKPQDGKINFSKFGPLKIELRVATLPTAGGLEDVVLRVLANGEPIPLDQMGIRAESLASILELIAKPYGLFLVCGPTGSGKTTTLHSILGHINTPEKKIWTAEDPVEITQAGLRQVQVNSKINLTFANAMRAFLRADPDIIMVGEMRDAETAATGIEASLTGHLVFSTLHTNSATESVVRLLDMGMDPFNFADSLLGILAQRLAKRLCPICKGSHEASEEEINELLEEYGSDLFKAFSKEEKEKAKNNIRQGWIEKFSSDGALFIPTATGCEECGDTGYDGRIALHELLISTNEIKKLIHEHGSVTDLAKQAFLQDMITLKQDGIEKILQGQT